MWPPLLRIMLDEPGLLTGYVSAYAQLLKQDAAWWQSRQVRRLGYLLLLASAGLLALLFAGVALMLHAATASGHWLLWAVPAVPLAVAMLAGWAYRRAPPTVPAFPRVREQLAQDMQLFGLKDPP